MTISGRGREGVRGGGREREREREREGERGRDGFFLGSAPIIFFFFPDKLPLLISLSFSFFFSTKYLSLISSFILTGFILDTVLVLRAF